MAAFTVEELVRIRDEHEAWLRAQPGVVGTGVGLTDTGETHLKIYGDGLLPETRTAIKERLPEIPITFEETGRPRTVARS